EGPPAGRATDADQWRGKRLHEGPRRRSVDPCGRGIGRCSSGCFVQRRIALWRNLMATMRVVQVSHPNGPFEIVERPIPEPGAGTVRIKVLACGICHSDSITKEGLFPGIQYPRVPGHEVAGVIDAVGPGVPGWERGQR